MAPSNPLLICIPVCVESAEELNAALNSAAAIGDLVEVRLDCLKPGEFESAVSRLSYYLTSLGKDSIVTFRPAEEGGVKDYSKNTRKCFWLDQVPSAASLFDVELDLVEEITSSSNVDLDWARVICSHHDFGGLPRDLENIYNRMSRTPARILKIAVQVNDVTECISLFRLLARARAEGREAIVIGMGQAGVLTRVLGPSRGSFLTYGAAEASRATAPGQLSARELRELFRVDSITSVTEIVGLVGLPTGHSISPYLHNSSFAASGIDAVYLPFEVSDLKAFVTRMVKPHTRELEWNLRGLSITAPHKSAIMQYLDYIDPAASEIGAVNTIVINDGDLYGYNTDAEGFIKPLLERLDSVTGLRCAVIGAGGAARTACWALKRQGASVSVFGRSAARARALADEFGCDYQLLSDKPLTGFDLVINATPLGTRGIAESQSVATSDQLRGVGLAYDLVYNPRETKFLKEAEKAGCNTLGGLAMLVAQAKQQFHLWANRQTPEGIMEEAAERALA